MRLGQQMENKEDIFKELKERYAPEEAKELIDGMLSRFRQTCKIDFRKKDAEIVDSYLVKDINVRRIICEIIARTGMTKRSHEELSAEWRVHNVSYRLGFMKRHSKDVSLDYSGDPRGVVRLANKIFRKFHME